MIVKKLPVSEPVLLIKNLFSEEEKKLIIDELLFLCKDYKLLGPDHTGTARDENGSPKKANRGLFLDNVYGIRNISDILGITRKYFSEEFMSCVEGFDPIFKYIRRSNSDSTLLSYYENKSHYESHEDEAIISIITYYWKEEKKFTGGNLTFPTHNYTVELLPWDVIVFPSFIEHRVESINLLPDVKENELNGRVSITNFVSKRDFNKGL